MLPAGEAGLHLAGLGDCSSWAGERKTLLRLNHLIEQALRDPAVGLGKPQRLSRDLTGCRSRRIDQEHRLVYEVAGTDLIALQARRHH